MRSLYLSFLIVCPLLLLVQRRNNDAFDWITQQHDFNNYKVKKDPAIIWNDKTWESTSETWETITTAWYVTVGFYLRDPVLLLPELISTAYVLTSSTVHTSARRSQTCMLLIHRQKKCYWKSSREVLWKCCKNIQNKMISGMQFLQLCRLLNKRASSLITIGWLLV